MKKFTRLCVLLFTLLSVFNKSFSQTSWTGNINTNWNTAGNWTTGVPTTTTNVTIGDASFTGLYQPSVNVSSSCNSITIGTTVASTLTLRKNLVVGGNFTINANGTVTQPNSTTTVKGNWINNGVYTTTSTLSKIVFGGTAQTIGGSNLTTFRRVTVNTGSVVTLAANTSVGGSSSYFYVYGTLVPGQSPTYALTSTVNFKVYNNGKIKVNAATFAANYILPGTVTLNAGSIVEYSSTSVNQTVSAAYSYSTLIISGTGTKSLTANLPSLNSTSSTKGNIFVTSGTFDMDIYTANRGSSTAGGELNISNGAFLKIAGTTNFPANYNTRTFALASTVEYNGGAQTISAQFYGNLIFSSNSGAAVKTMPGTAFTVDGNFTSTKAAGTSVAYTAASDITINGNINIGTATSFTGGTYSHIIRGNWVNDGTYTGSTGTVSFDGPSKNIGGSGVQNFNNVNILRSGITASGNINVSGNFACTNPGQFIHNAGGLLTMTGASKTITGANIIFNDITISGTVSTTASFTISGSLAVPGSFSATTGIIIMSGSSKVISGAGGIGFSTIQMTGTISTASSFSVSTLLDISGTFSASAGTATFSGTSILSGTANLYNATISGTSLQLSSAAVLGIANVFTIAAGTLNVTSTTPNTVNFNGTGAQNVNGIPYNNLTLSNGGTKTATGGTTVNGNITIAASTTFSAASYAHTILRNWVNSGIFTAGTSTVQFTGVNNASLSGTTTFNILTVNKSSATNSLSLLNDISAATVNMTTGKILTGSNKVTITTTRTGNGIILGTITRTHTFTTATSYAFEGPDNTINFSAASAVTSITVTVTSGNLPDFPNNASVNREYNIAVTATSYTATLRLHYEDAELNGNNEASMGLWNYPGAWTTVGKSANSTINNYVEQTGLTNITSRWTCAEIPAVVRWNGSSSSSWNTAANWTVVSGAASTPPAITDIVQIGTTAFTNQPTISTAVTVKGITYGSTQASTLTLASGGSLAVSGNISGTWTADATHVINTDTQNMTVNGTLALSNGVNNRSINLIIGTGTVTVAGSVIQKGNASLVFSAAGTLNIGTDFLYTSGTFTGGTGSVTYNGIDQQNVGAVAYNNLTVNKSAGNSTLSSTITVAGNLTLTAGSLDVASSGITVNGNISISSGAILDCDGVNINIAGNWTNSGTYINTSGAVIFNGTGVQNISAGVFNDLTINKSAGTANLTGNNSLGGNLSILAGTLNLSTYTLNRGSVGGSFSMSTGTNLQVAGANNFPSNYSVNPFDPASTVLYNGSVAQTVGGVTYGNLSFSNGGSNAKTQSASIGILGDLLINSGATLHSGGFVATLSGNFTNSGTYTASTGTVILNGSSKTITGNTSFYRVTVNGSYTVAGSDINYNGPLVIGTGASYAAGAGTANVSNDLTNSGTLTSTGTTNFTGTSVQTIRLLNAILSSSTGIINFNGNIAPVLNSTSSPQFATVNINNTAGINPSVNWTVFVAMNVNAGATFNAGLSTHTIYGSFTNNGTVTSTGTLNFVPSTTKTIALGSSGFTSDGIINFGGTGQMTITGAPGALNTIIISNTNSAGVSAPSNWTIDSNFVVTQNAIFNAGSYTYTVGGNIESDGTLNGQTSTFTVTSATAELSASSETIFNNITVAGTATLTPQTDFRVAGNFTNNGIYDGSVGVLIMTGSAAGVIGGSTTPSSIAQLTVEKSGGAVVTQNVNITDLLFLNIFSGTLFTSTYTITQDAGGGILIINDAATLKLGGTNSLPGFSGYGLDVNSNVDYAGVATTQSVGNAAVYGNLIISGTGNKNAYTALTVAGNLTMSSGTLNTNTFTVSHSIAGNFVMTGGTLTGTNSTYILNGTNDQALTLLSNLIKLTINKTSGFVNLGSNITVNTTLNFIDGIIQTGNYSVIIPASAVVTGAGQSTGWIKGNLQKNIATGSSVSRIFELGDINYYSPATVLFATVSTSGNLTASATATDHNQVDYSGIDSTKSVNRFWSFTNSGTVFTTAIATFNWVASDLDAGTTTANFKTALYNGSGWVLTSTGSPLATSIQATGLTSFGDFAIGERISLYRWTGEAFTADWNTAKNWSGGLPTTTFNTLIPNRITGGRVYPVLSSGTGAVNNLTIESTSTLTVSGGTLQIAGTTSNSGTFTTTNGTIEFNGSAAQIISPGLFANNTIKNLVISNNVSLADTDTLTGTLTVTAGKTFTTNDNFVLKSNASGTARIASLPVDGSGNATAFITGTVSIERYIPMRKAWRLLSAPVKSATSQTINAAWQEGVSFSFINNPNPGYGVFITGGTTANGFDQGLTSNTTIKVFNPASNNFVALPPSPGTNRPITDYPGYFLYVRGDRSIDLMQGNAAATTITTLRMKGEINTGSKTTNVNATSYTIFGNPYPSAIDFETLTRSNVKNSFYVWDPKLSGNFGLGGFVTFSWNSGTGMYDATTSASPVSKYIPSGEAIIIESADGTNPGTITVKESDKSANGSDAVFGRPGFGTIPVPNQQVRVNLFSVNTDSTRSLIDGVLTTYERSNSNSIDNNDAKKLNGGSENIGIKRDSKMLSIERRKTIAVTDTTYLNIYQMKIANYELQITADNMNRAGVTAVIKDRYSNTINNMPLDMNGITKIRFSVNADPASYSINRFSIVFMPKNAVPLAFETQRAYRRKKDIAVEWKIENEGDVKEYEVERSANAQTFTKINTTTAIAAKGGDAQYKIIDTDPVEGNNYYRIRSVGQDGKTNYSPIIKVDKEVLQINPSVVVYPNPVTGNTISIQLNNLEKGNYTMQLFNAAAQLVAVKTIKYNGAFSVENFEINERFAAGKYELKLTGEAVKINIPVIKR